MRKLKYYLNKWNIKKYIEEIIQESLETNNTIYIKKSDIIFLSILNPNEWNTNNSNDNNEYIIFY